MTFENRRAAGRRLATELREYTGSDTIVLGITRDGMAVAAEVARMLRLPFDALVVHKIAKPTQPALAVATVAEPDQVVVNQHLVDQLALPAEWLAEAVAQGIREVGRRGGAYRGDRERCELAGLRVIVVDDAAATGVTLQAAVLAVRAMGAREVIVAVPVIPVCVAEAPRAQVTQVVSLATPADLIACGIHYPLANEASDDEICHLLGQRDSTPPHGVVAPD
jgi:putative phosphoribosyl transferase